MAEENNNVFFYTGTKEEYDAGSKLANGIYFVSDTHEIYKGETRYGTSTPIATTSVVGSVKPSRDDFNIAADGTLTLYRPISFTSAAMNKQSTTGLLLEDGQTSDISLAWTLSTAPTATTVTSSNSAEKPSVNQTAINGTYVSTAVNAARNWTVTVTDAKGSSSKKTFNVYFGNKILYYTGVNPTAIDQAFLKGAGVLKTSLQTSFTGTISPTSSGDGQYIFIAFPSSWVPSGKRPTFKVGGYEGGFSKMATVSDYTNDSGKVIPYDVWRSGNTGLGQIQIELAVA